MKKLFLITVLLLISTFSVFASDNTPRFWVLDSFEKGLNSHISEYKTPDNQAHDASNVRFNDSYGKLSKRDALLAYGDTGSSAVTGLHRYYKSDSTTKLIAATGTLLQYGTDDTGVFTTIKTGLTDGKRWNFLTYKDVAIGTNGYDQLIKWDGYTQTTANTDNSRTVSELCAELGAPFAQLSSESGGNDLDAESWYMYKVAFYDGSTYDYSTARSNPIKTGTAATTTQNLSLTDIPLGPSGTTHRYIYRTLGDSTQANVLADTTYYMVKDIADNTTVTADDAMTDGTADDNTAPTWATASAGTNVTPPKGTLAEISSERMFISGNTTYPSDLYWSDQFNPDHFTPADFVQVRPDDGDKVTFIKTFLGTLTVGKTNSIQKFYTVGDPTTDQSNPDHFTPWYLSDPFSFVGCPAPYSVAVSPKGIVYLGRNGLYIFGGQYSQLISDAVTPEINDISQTNISECVGYYHNNQYRLSYTSEESGAATNNRVLLYDFTRDAYTIDIENVNCFASFGAGTDFGTLYSGSSTTDGYVFAHRSSANFLNKRYKSDFDEETNNDLLTNGNFENWSAGTTVAPDNWTAAGGGMSVARESTIVKTGTYSAKVTRAGTDCDINQIITSDIYAGRTMTFGAWVYATVADRGRLILNDGVDSTISSNHTGDSTWQFLTVTKTFSAAATRLYCGCGIGGGDTSAYFDGAICVEVEENNRFDDIRSYGTEEEPIQEIAWDCTITTWLTELQTKDASINTIADIGTYLPSATIARPDLSGTWTSPVYDINAQALDKLYWNESLGSYGDVTFQIRTGGVVTPDGTWSAWSSTYSNPSGSDISGLTAARYIQIKFNLSTTNINYSPTLYQTDGYVFRISYSKVGANYETSILSLYRTGWKDFGIVGYQKKLNRIKAFYSGTSGTLSINYKNDTNDVNKTFSIDLSVSPSASTTDLYSGDETNKIYTFYPPMNSATDPSAIGQYFQFTITESGTIDWTLSKLEVEYGVEEIF